MPLFIIYIQPLTSFRDSFSVGITVYSLQDNQEALRTEDKCSNSYAGDCEIIKDSL